MVEEKKGIVSAFACMVKDCPGRFIARADCWQHIEQHGLAAYFAPVLLILEPEPVKPAPKVENVDAPSGEVE